MAEQNKRVVILAGPTAVGKSKVAAKICEACRGLIVSADSVQAYQSVSIGANKPTEEEWTKTPHMLVDVIDTQSTSDDNYNAAEWRRDALFCIQSLLDPTAKADIFNDEALDEAAQKRQEVIRSTIVKAKRIKGYSDEQTVLPVVVGGTMMYVQWLVQGRPDALRPTESALKRADESLKEHSWESAVAFVKSMGSPYDAQVAKLCENDWYRLRRIVEVAYTCEEQSTEQKNQQTATKKEGVEGAASQNTPPVVSNTDLYTGERQGGLSDLGFDVRCFFLCPDDRKEHCRVVDERCEQMLQRGLLTETTDLAVSKRLPGMVQKAIGYRQTLTYLGRENTAKNDAAAFDDFMVDFQGSTRRYAKRQMQWFRKDNNFVFVPVAVKGDSNKTPVDAAQQASDEIIRMLHMTREEYDLERLSDATGEDETSNQRIRRVNAEQGKRMKTFQSKRSILLPGTEALEKIMHEADECTRRYQDYEGVVGRQKRPRAEDKASLDKAARRI